jgi:hypothetical protein
MRSSWVKWLAVVAVIFMASGNAHASSEHAHFHSVPCAHHHEADESHAAHNHAADAKECCCRCLGCPSALVEPFADLTPRSVTYEQRWLPARSEVLVDRPLSPELDPPRPGALS